MNNNNNNDNNKNNDNNTTLGRKRTLGEVGRQSTIVEGNLRRTVIREVVERVVYEVVDSDEEDMNNIPVVDNNKNKNNKGKSPVEYIDLLDSEDDSDEVVQHQRNKRQRTNKAATATTTNKGTKRANARGSATSKVPNPHWTCEDHHLDRNRPWKEQSGTVQNTTPIRFRRDVRSKDVIVRNKDIDCEDFEGWGEILNLGLESIEFIQCNFVNFSTSFDKQLDKVESEMTRVFFAGCSMDGRLMGTDASIEMVRIECKDDWTLIIDNGTPTNRFPMSILEPLMYFAQTFRFENFQCNQYMQLPTGHMFTVTRLEFIRCNILLDLGRLNVGITASFSQSTVRFFYGPTYEPSVHKVALRDRDGDIVPLIVGEALKPELELELIRQN